MLNLRKRVTIAIVGVSALGLGVASAATLGTLSSSSLGATDNIVASCDSDGVAIAYATAYDPASGKYRTSAATVSGMAAACTGKALSVTLRDTNGLALGNGTATVGGTSQVVTLSASVAADAVTGAAVVITG
jgi:hypothetical protein